jgi:hypothetical protein
VTQHNNSPAAGALSAAGADDVFISYSSLDVDQAAALQKALEARPHRLVRQASAQIGGLGRSGHRAGAGQFRRRRGDLVRCRRQFDLGSGGSDYTEREGKILPLGLDGFRAGALGSALRDDTFISLDDTIAAPSDSARQIRVLRDALALGRRRWCRLCWVSQRLRG